MDHILRFIFVFYTIYQADTSTPSPCNLGLPNAGDEVRPAVAFPSIERWPRRPHPAVCPLLLTFQRVDNVMPCTTTARSAGQAGPRARARTSISLSLQTVGITRAVRLLASSFFLSPHDLLSLLSSSSCSRRGSLQWREGSGRKPSGDKGHSWRRRKRRDAGRQPHAPRRAPPPRLRPRPRQAGNVPSSISLSRISPSKRSVRRLVRSGLG
jgi:hypothetical protein